MAKKKKREVEVKIEDLKYPAKGLGSIVGPESYLVGDAFVPNALLGREIFCKGGIPGQVWRASTGRTRGDKKEVNLLELYDRSPIERESMCPVSDICGGCSYQTLTYEAELMLKGQQMRDLFDEAGLDAKSLSIHRSPVVRGYRNKMEYTFGDAVYGGRLVLGLHRQKRFYEIVDTQNCNIVIDDYNMIRRHVQAFFRARGIDYLHKRTREGWLRHLVVRSSKRHKQIMVNLVTTAWPEGDATGATNDKDLVTVEENGVMVTRHAAEQALLDAFVDGLLGLPTDFEITSIYHTINNSTADAVIAEELHLLYGQEYLVETLMDLTFHIGPFSFFQPNPIGAENLYKKAIEYAGDLEGKEVYDLYSGTGTLTQIMAKSAQRVVGVEIVEEAVEKAKESAERNEIVNATFRAADVLVELDKLAESDYHPDVIVIDPPREGIHPKALPKIAAAKPERIVYISCNPTTLVRDIQAFQELGYQYVKGMAFDQFPRTKHVECVVLMSCNI